MGDVGRSAPGPHSDVAALAAAPTQRYAPRLLPPALARPCAGWMTRAAAGRALAGQEPRGRGGGGGEDDDWARVADAASYCGTGIEH